MFGYNSIANILGWNAPGTDTNNSNLVSSDDVSSAQGFTGDEAVGTTNAVANIDWSKELEGLFSKYDDYIKGEMSYNKEAMEQSMNYNAQQAEIEREFNSAEAVKQRAFNSAEAQAERDWQEYMSSTSYQRAVSDMKKAGLNPMLLYMKTTGSPVSSGANATSGLATSTSARSSGNARVSLSEWGNNNLKAIASLISSVGNVIGSLNPFSIIKKI